MPPSPTNLIIATIVIVLAANRGLVAYKIYQRRRVFQPRTFRAYFASTLFIFAVLIVVVGLMGKGWYAAGALTSALCAIAMLARDVFLGKSGRKDLDDHWVR